MLRPPPSDNLFLIGYRGVGKTAVALRLAERLGREAIDADAQIERRGGRSIAEIFSQGGEEEFRQIEATVLDEISRVEHRILSLGGGIVLRPGNRAKINARGKTVWLIARPATLWQRITADQATAGRRPNLTAAGGLAEVQQLLAGRLQAYRECADWVVDTEGKTPDEVAAEIVLLVQGAASGAQS
jgi:shikimate kinase